MAKRIAFSGWKGEVMYLSALSFYCHFVLLQS